LFWLFCFKTIFLLFCFVVFISNSCYAILLRLFLLQNTHFAISLQPFCLNTLFSLFCFDFLLIGLLTLHCKLLQNAKILNKKSNICKVLQKRDKSSSFVTDSAMYMLSSANNYLFLVINRSSCYLSEAGAKITKWQCAMRSFHAIFCSKWSSELFITSENKHSKHDENLRWEF
jgi:hypothetical protein